MCCVISFPFSIWLAAATNTMFIRSKVQASMLFQLQTTTLQLSLSCRSIIVAACCHYHRGEKKVSQQYYIFFLNITFVGISCGLEYLHRIIFKSPLTIFLLKIGESINITSKAVPLGNILSDK